MRKNTNSESGQFRKKMIKSVISFFIVFIFTSWKLFAYDPALLPKSDSAINEKNLTKGQQLFLQGKYAELNSYLKSLKENGRLNPDDELLECRLLIITGKYKEAEKILRKEIKKNPENFAARMLLTDVYKASGQKRALRLQQRYFRNAVRSGNLHSAVAFTAAGKSLALRSPKIALQLFLKARKIDPLYEPAYVEAGLLGYDFFSWSQARKDFAKALSLDAKNLKAMCGLAMLSYAAGNLKVCGAIVDQVLKINPQYPDALEIKARILITEEKFKEAFELIDKIDQINPNRISSQSLIASYYDMKGEGKKRDEQIAKIQQLRPNDADVYINLAVSALKQYRNPDAVKWARKALETDPENWEGFFECGLALLRLGEEKEGFKMLEKSFKLNPYNVPAYNILTILDRDFKGKELVMKESEHFVVKMPRNDVEIIWPYLEKAMEDAYKKFTEKYKIKPIGPKEYQGKILALILDDPQSFSVRTIGLTGLGAVGVCFGQVVMMPSPRFACIGNGKGLNWKSTFEHEFLHVIILQKTNYKTSRWFTEGISTDGESDTHGNWRGLFTAAGKKRKLLPIEKLETGFIRPVYPAQVPTSYYQAALTCRFLEEKYGFDAMMKIIEGYAQGKKTKTLIPEVCGVSLKELNAQLDKYYQRHWQDDGKKLKELYENLKKEIDVIQQQNKEAGKEPKKGQRNWEPVVQSWLEKGEREKAVKFLENMLTYHSDDYRPLKKLGDLYFEDKKYQQAVDNYQMVFFLNPYDFQSHKNAALCYEKLGRDKLADREKAIIKHLIQKVGGSNK